MGTIPAVPAFPAGYAATSTAMNELGLAIQYAMMQRPLCQLQQNTPQSLTNATIGGITWDTKITDRDAGYSAGTNTRYTAQTPGIYLASASVIFAANTNGTRRIFFKITTGGSNPGGSGNVTQIGVAGSNPTSGSVCCCAARSLTPYLYVGDFVEVFAFQDSGGALSTSTGSFAVPYFTITMVSG